MKKKKLISVKVRNGDINKALRKFKRLTFDSGHLLELKERTQYTKPTTKKRKQKLEAIRENKRRVQWLKENT